MNPSAGLTDLVHRAQRGDPEAANALFDATYRELRRLARARLRVGGRDALLDTTALVHEAYLRFARTRGLRLEDRVHFMRYAGRVMRSVIVDFARRRNAERRGGAQSHVTLRTGDGEDAGADQILRVHEALRDLEKLDPRMAQIVELRYFAGLNDLEISEVLAVTDRTVRREWHKARLWLAQALR